MEDKSSEDQPAQENLAQESNTESNEMRGDASAALTETSDSTGEAAGDEIPQPSIQSEPTSNLEMVSTSKTSDSEIPCEGGTSDAEKEAEPSPLLSEPTSDIKMTSRSTSEIPWEGVEISDAEKKPDPSTLPSERTYSTEISSSSAAPSKRTYSIEISSSTATPSAVSCEGVKTSSEKKSEPTLLTSEPTVELGSALAQSENVREVTAVDTGATSKSPKRSVRQFLSGFGRFISPTKSGKSKANRSKLVSPSKVQSPDRDNSKRVSMESPVSSEKYSKKGKENDGVLKRCRKVFNFKNRSKPSSESANLVSDEETDRIEEPKASKVDYKPKPRKRGSVWNEVKSSLTEVPSSDGTTMTDIPSTFSGADVFSSDSSKTSETGENIPEETAAGNLVSSPDEEILDIQEKNMEGIKDAPSTEQNTENIVSAKTSMKNQLTTEDGPINKETCNVAADENSKENPSTEKDGSSTDAKANRSKSVSPSKVQSPDRDNSKRVSMEAPVSSEKYSKKGKENDGVLKRLTKGFNIKKRSKTSSESANLVSDEETDRIEEHEASKVDNLPELIRPDRSIRDSGWTEIIKPSLTEKPSYDGTTMTDLPSTSSGGDVFPSDSSKTSETGENISDEAVADSLASTPDESILDIQDKNMEGIKDAPSTDQNTENIVSAKTSKENQLTTEDGPISKETFNVAADDNSKENPSTEKDGSSTDAKTNVTVAGNSKENQYSSNDDPSSDEETTNEAEKQSTPKD